MGDRALRGTRTEATAAAAADGGATVDDAEPVDEPAVADAVDDDDGGCCCLLGRHCRSRQRSDYANIRLLNLRRRWVTGLCGQVWQLIL